MRLSEATDAYLASLRAERRSPRTIDAYRRDLATLRAPLGDPLLANVTPRDLLAWAAAHSTATSSANRARSAVRGLFGFAIRMWWITRDPATVLRIKLVQPDAVRPLAPGAEVQLLAVIDATPTWEAHRDALLIRTALATGLRVSSLVALDAGDIEPELGRLVVRVKGGHTMAVTVATDLAEALMELAAVAGGAVFTTRRGRRLGVRQVQMRLADWSRRSGLPRLHPHALRHTFGSRCYAATKDLRAVQLAMGHRSVTTTQRYVG